MTNRNWIFLLCTSISLFAVCQCVDSLAAEKQLPATLGWTVPTEIEPINAPFEMPQLKRPVFPDRTFNITNYGAVSDGKTKNTNAFRKAIDACHATGGGQVLVPEGKWFTGPIHLKSNVNLHFEQGAELHFSDDPIDYLPVVFTRWTGFELYNYSPLIYAKDCENIAITGPGKLYGHGKTWWRWKQDGKTARHIYEEQVLKNVPPEKRVYGTPEAGLRPQFISPMSCKNVFFEGFTVAEGGPFWTFDILYCENVIVRNLQVDTVGGRNTDGLNISSSRNVLIEYCLINAGDDCIALKSGLNEEGWRIGRPTENVVVRYVKALRCHGGVVIGSEMSGGVRNIFARNCVFDGSDIGIRLKSNRDRGGVVEKLWYRDIEMKNIRKRAVSINTNYGSYMASKNGNAWPLFRDITIQNITCDGVDTAIYLGGNEHKPIENVTLENLSIKAKTGMTFLWVNGLRLDNVKVQVKKGEPLDIKNCRDVVQSVEEPALKQ